MWYAVPVDEMNTIVFLNEHPPRGYEEYHGQPQEGVHLEQPEKLNLWTNGAKAPEIVLARSRTQRQNFKVFKYRHDFEREQKLFEDTHRSYTICNKRQFLELMKGVIRLRYHGQWIAWTKDRKKLLAAAKDFEQLDKQVERSGKGPAVFELVESLVPQADGSEP